MSSHVFQLSSRSRRLLWRNQHKEYQESIAGDQALLTDTTSTRAIRRPRSGPALIRLWDPVAFFPPEIALICLRQALPSGANHPAALIELTSVSLGWQKFLFSTPGLWTEIHVRYSAQDLLAIISLFLHLSSNAPLNLTVWNTMGPEWGDIKALVLPNSYRIHSLALGDDPPIYSDTPYAGAAYLSLASDVFNSLNRLPCLVNIDFGRALQVDPSQLKPLDLTSGIRIHNHIFVTMHDLSGSPLPLTLLPGRDKPSDTRNTAKALSDLLHIDSSSPFNRVDDSITSFNFNIISLVDILAPLDCAIEVSTNARCMNFVNRSDNGCRLCNRKRRSLSAVLGCVRFHFGLRPFHCPGCRTCSRKKGYAKFCTSHLLLNHIGPTTCAICGTQKSERWEQDVVGDPVCGACQLQIQGQDLDLDAWLSQIVAGSADPGSSQLLTDLGALIPMASDDSLIEGSDVEFFDFTAYREVDSTAPGARR